MTVTSASRPILVSASMDATIRLWDALTQKQLEVLHYKDSQINDICITPDGAQCCVGAWQSVRIYDLANPSETGLHTFNVHDKNVTVVGFQQDGEWMFTGGEDCTAKIWDMRVNQLNCQRIFQLPSPIHSVALHPNQVELIVADSTGAIYLWDLRSDRDDSLITEVDMSEYIVHVNVDRAGRQCAAVTNRGQLFIWDIGHSGMMMQATTEIPSSNIASAVSIEQQSSHTSLLSGAKQSLNDLPSITSEALPQSRVPLDAHGSSLLDENTQQTIFGEDVDIPDVGKESSLKMIGTTKQTNLAAQKAHQSLTELTLSIPAQQLQQNAPNQHSLSSVINNARPFARLRAHPTFALKCRFRPDGMAIATTSADQTTKLWSLSNHKLLDTYTVPGNKWVWDCAFTNDSKYMITATSDGILRMWDVNSVEVVRKYQGHSMGITAMAFYDCS